VRRGSEDSSCSKGRYYSFSTLVADRLNSALEAIAALSFQDAATVSLNPLCGPEKLLSSCSSPAAQSSIKITAPALRLENGVDVVEEKGSREKSQSNDCAGGSADLSIVSSGISSRGKQCSRKRAGSELTHIDLVRPVNEGVSNLHHNPCVSPSTSARVVRCLVVDDSVTSRRMLRRLLAAQNYFVLEATDGKNCIHVWEGECKLGESVDVIFMDSLMPVMTGTYTAATLIRNPHYHII
jgi:CheY-like chemotaxis protein